MENHFKNKLKNYKVDWNKEDLLADLEIALSEKKPSKRKWLPFFILGILIVPICWGINIFNSDIKSNSSEHIQLNIETKDDNKTLKTIKAANDNSDDNFAFDKIIDNTKDKESFK
ncbi:hypothetical protein N9L92_03530 [Saprospiraceae bacterium]|nr:hypothetical protein [Saprospiraceae bacterium]